MRPIDADALIEKLGIAKECNDCKHNKEPYCRWKPDVVDICEAINDAPTIDDRKTGKWVYDTCSKCGKNLWDYFHFTEDGRIIEEPNFCPNCGVDMRGERDGRNDINTK